MREKGRRNGWSRARWMGHSIGETKERKRGWRERWVKRKGQGRGKVVGRK